MIASSSLKKFFTLLGALQLALVGAHAQDQVEPKLHWFDSRGELVELDWPVSVQWIWSDHSIEAQLWIEVPEHLDLEVEESTQLKLLKGRARGDSSHQLLIVSMHTPKITAQLIRQEPDAEPEKIGLVVNLLGEAPKLLLHESCIKDGVSLQQNKTGANFLFLAARCRQSKEHVDVTLLTSDDAFPVNESAKPLSLSNAAKSLTIRIPKKTWKALSPGKSIASVKVATQPSQPEPAHFELVYRKGTAVPGLPARVALRKAVQVVPAQELQPAKTWTFAAGLSLAHLGYSASGLSPSEYNLELSLRAERKIFSSGLPLQFEASLPVVSFMPSFFHFPASGFYDFAGRVALPITSTPGFTFRLAPGLKLGAVHLEKRDSESGFYVGPQLMAEASGKVAAWGDRTYEARVGFAALGGRGNPQLFHSFEISTKMALEFIKGDTERRWDLVLDVNYLNLASPGAQAADVVKGALGVRTWY